jgi:hypothetical protein
LVKAEKAIEADLNLFDTAKSGTRLTTGNNHDHARAEHVSSLLRPAQLSHFRGAAIERRTHEANVHIFLYPSICVQRQNGACG